MMKKISGLLLVTGFLLLLTGCPYGYRYDEGKFPSEPVNFQAVNSIYDDYNSTSPVIESERYLYFSSNRNSNGDEFDITGDNFHVLWDKDNGKLAVDDKPHSWKDYDYVDSLLARVNSGYDEFGPYSLSYYSYFMETYSYTDLLIFSNDEQGHHDLKLAWFSGMGENPGPDDGAVEGPEPISFLNSPFNDAYLSFYGPGFILYEYPNDPSWITEILFCSDRDGDFDIYHSPVQPDSTIIDFLLNNTGGQVIPVDILNSADQDKCPYVNGGLMVFASDRPGGFGGFDLYYSRREENTWSEPVNFGERINTEYDEYRPVALLYFEFLNDLMLFSSNRPGGKGGYDLYYVGIPKMID